MSGCKSRASISFLLALGFFARAGGLSRQRWRKGRDVFALDVEGARGARGVEGDAS